MSADKALIYGSPEHAAAEAIAGMANCHEGWITDQPTDLAVVVIAGLRERGFVVTREPLCDCGWIGVANHQHDRRLGRTDTKGS